MKRTSLLVVFFTACWYLLLFMMDWQIVETINLTFMASLIAFIIFACIHILRTGFLHIFIDGFRKIGNALSSKSNAMQRADAQLKSDENLQGFKNRINKWIYDVTFSFSVASLIVSLVGLVMYY